MNALLALRPAKPLGVHFRHPCLACPSRCTEPLHPHSHLKRTSIPLPAPPPLSFNERSADSPNRTIPCFAPSSLPPLSKVRCCRPKNSGDYRRDCSPFAPSMRFSALSLAPHYILAFLVKGELLLPRKAQPTIEGSSHQHRR